MQKRWLIHGMVACAAIIGSAEAVHAQYSSGGSSGGGSSGLSSNGGVGGTTPTGSSGGINSLGNTGGGSTKSSSAGTTIPAASDPNSSTYNNPLAIGISGVSTQFSYNSSGGVTQIGPSSGFGTPTFAASTVNYGSTTVKNSTGTNGEGFNTLSMPKTPAYVTVLSKYIPYVKHDPTKLQETLVNTLARAPFLEGKKGIFLAVDGSTVFLKGEVTDPTERRVVEGVVRMTPGVRNVVNELVALNKD